MPLSGWFEDAGFVSPCMTVIRLIYIVQFAAKSSWRTTDFYNPDCKLVAVLAIFCHECVANTRGHSGYRLKLPWRQSYSGCVTDMLALQFPGVPAHDLGSEPA